MNGGNYWASEFVRRPVAIRGYTTTTRYRYILRLCNLQIAAVLGYLFVADWTGILQSRTNGQVTSARDASHDLLRFRVASSLDSAVSDSVPGKEILIKVF